MRMPFISVVIPAYNEAANLPAMVARLRAVLEPIGDWELLFVDDGSSDDTLALLRRLRSADERIRYLSFSRNFGHQNALRAGLERSRGELVVTMDGDLQQPPELIPSMVQKYREGYQIVNTLRRGEKNVDALKKLTSRGFYRMINALGDIRIEDGAADFRLISHNAKDAMLSFGEQGIFWRGVVPWVGFRQCALPYEAAPRLHGETKYGFRRMLGLALDGITSFSVKPLQLTTIAGAVCSGFAFVYAVYALAMRLFSDATVAGWTSLLISVLFIGGIQLLSLGIIGEYLGKLFMESKRRPHYIIAEESE